MYLSWEIFFNEKLTFKKKPLVMIKEVDWMECMDAEAMETMLKMEGTCSPSLMRIQVILIPSSCQLWGNLIIGLKLSFLKMWEKSV